MGAGSAGISRQTDYVRNGQHIDRRVERFGNIRKSILQQKKKGEMMLETVYRKYICCYRGNVKNQVEKKHRKNNRKKYKNI